MQTGSPTLCPPGAPDRELTPAPKRPGDLAAALIGTAGTRGEAHQGHVTVRRSGRQYSVESVFGTEFGLTARAAYNLASELLGERS